MASVYSTLAGGMPSPLLPEFDDWRHRLRTRRVEACPIARSSTYYFDATAGDDTTGDGTITAPWQTIAKAQSVHDDPGDGSDPEITHGGSDFALLFKRGETWREADGLAITADSVTVGAYGSGARPNLTCFTVQYPASGGAWTNVTGNQYKIGSIAAEVGWVRIANKPYAAPLTLVGSTGAVASTDYSWFWDSGASELHINVAADPDTLDIEYAPANTKSGITVSGDQNRVDSIKAEGWGLKPSDPNNQGYGIKVAVTGTDEAVVSNCAAYYTSRNAIGVYHGSSGGFATFIDISAGYCLRAGNSALVFIDYTTSGGGEFILHNATCAYGPLPEAGKADIGGSAFYAHTGGGAAVHSLVLVSNMVIPASAHSVAGPGYANNVPAATSITDCRALFIDEKVRVSSLGTYSPAPVNCARINSDVEITMTSAGVAALTTDRQAGWFINGKLIIDTSSTSEARVSVYNTAVSTNSPKLWNSLIFWLGNGTSFTCIDYDQFGGTAGTSPTGEMFNCIYGIRQLEGGTVKTCKVSLNNQSGYLGNNAYYGISVSTDLAGYSTDDNATVLNDEPSWEYTPVDGSLLNIAGSTDLGIGYDRSWRKRLATAPTIGPRQALPSSPLQTGYVFYQ